MYRGTTPTLIYNINSNLDLNGMLQIWVTLKTLMYEKTFSKDDIIVNNENKTLTIELSQEDTLNFYGSNVETQVRFLDSNRKAYASNIKKIILDNILKEGVIHE